MIDLRTGADIAEILTAVVATLGYAYYRWGFINNRLRLERYLKRKAAESALNPRFKNDKGKYSSLHLAAELRIPEDEVIKAGYSSKKLKPIPTQEDGKGRAVAIYFQYVG
jgi:hypothetical protein